MSEGGRDSSTTRRAARTQSHFYLACLTEWRGEGGRNEEAVEEDNMGGTSPARARALWNFAWGTILLLTRAAAAVDGGDGHAGHLGSDVIGGDEGGGTVPLAATEWTSKVRGGQ